MIAELIRDWAIGVLVSPFSWGIIWYVIFLVIYELVLALYQWSWPDLILRIGVIAASILGFIVGREFYNLPVIETHAVSPYRLGFVSRLTM